MSSKILIIDNFLENPDNIRRDAFLKSVNTHDYHPGQRTESFFSSEIDEKLRLIMGTNNIYYTGNSYSFQFNTSRDMTWVHSDVLLNELYFDSKHDHYAAVIYLTPNPPFESGTSIFNNKKYNYFSSKDILKNNKSINECENIAYNISSNGHGQDLSRWSIHTSMGNKYNRCVIYDASYFHQSSSYFGNTKEDCRLIQIVFFNILKDSK
jgi:hypothetical protein